MSANILTIITPIRLLIGPTRGAHQRIVWSLFVALALIGAGCRRDAMDEPMAGKTLRGTEVTRRTVDSFPAEPRDLFWRMDMVAGPDGTLQPLDFDENGNGRIDGDERDAIRGRNTWLIWGGGNETFWGWLQEQGYGLTDLLILLDSRHRSTRFKRTGLINQPGLETSAQPILGLYLDKAKGDGSAILRPPPERPASYTPGQPYNPYGTADSYGYGSGDRYAPPSDGYPAYYNEPEAERFDAQGRTLVESVSRPPSDGGFAFEPWTTREEHERAWKDKPTPDPFAAYIPDVVRRKLPQDGLDPAVYGYPSGIFGLRLWLNPDFFAKSDAAKEARAYWRERVENTNGRYYTHSDINADPKLIRPFRVSMSCGFCHIGPHPLSPPANPEEPKWENLSGIIGGQYWDTQPTFGNLLTRDSFLHHFLKSQAPGSVDTSLISTDHINNTNVINAVFDVPARLARAQAKPTETQSPTNLLLPSVEDPGNTGDQRHFPMVLFPGEDSVGVFGALARVYLNIGLFSEQWNNVDNPIIGFTPQRPFSVATCQSNSVFWNVNEKYRVPYLAKFFSLGAAKKVPKSTAPMLLKDAGAAGRDALTRDSEEQRKLGREVFIDNCAICHSSKQPAGFDLRFTRDMPGGWDKAPVPSQAGRTVYTLPMDYRQWEKFKESDAYRDYVTQLRNHDDLKAPGPEGQIGARDPFIEDNFLSNELRIPVTLVGTYSGRAMATNAMSGQVWDNFSSETFKNLESVGEIRYYNPYRTDGDKDEFDTNKDEFGTNDVYTDGREKGGPGYYRPASLISVWATAPYFHNNALGTYTHDPSIEGRLTAFDDGINKLLWNEKRAKFSSEVYDGGKRPGDLRSYDGPAAKGDPGYIYRLPLDSQIAFAAPFIRPLIENILSGLVGPMLGSALFSILSLWLWVALIALFIIGALRGRARHVGILVLGIAVLLAVVLAVTGAGGAGGTVTGAIMMMGAETLMAVPRLWLWPAILVLGVLGFWMLLTSREFRRATRAVFIVFALATGVGGFVVHGFLNGRYGGIAIGPIPRGTPVNLLMNIDPEKTDKVPAAVVALVRAMARIKAENLIGDDAYAVFSKTAGPALMAASKVPDFVLDRGHWFGEKLTTDQKNALIAFLKTI